MLPIVSMRSVGPQALSLGGDVSGVTQPMSSYNGLSEDRSLARFNVGSDARRATGECLIHLVLAEPRRTLNCATVRTETTRLSRRSRRQWCRSESQSPHCWIGSPYCRWSDCQNRPAAHLPPRSRWWPRATLEDCAMRLPLLPYCSQPVTSRLQKSVRRCLNCSGDRKTQSCLGEVRHAPDAFRSRRSQLY